MTTSRQPEPRTAARKRAHHASAQTHDTKNEPTITTRATHHPPRANRHAPNASPKPS